MDITHEQTELVQRARMAEQAKRYDDMRDFMKKATEFGVGLSPIGRHLLSTAYTNIIRHHRLSWRTISIIENKEDRKSKIWKRNDKSKQKVIKEYRETIEGELLQTCNDILKLLDTYLLPNSSDIESKVFYLKLKGDYNRFLAEFVAGQDRHIVVENSQRSYQEAYDIAKEEFSPIHSIRLSVALNFSVFYYEICDDTATASKLAKETIDLALPESRDALLPDEHEDSHLLMKLLQHNCSLWASDQHGGYQESGAGAEDDNDGGRSQRTNKNNK